HDVISEPHLLPTQQGADTIKVQFDPERRDIAAAVIYEQKCTENARDLFRDQVLPSFAEWVIGKRDAQLAQTAAALLTKFALTDEENRRVFDRLVQDRPISFQAALTVTPNPFDADQCLALFRGYAGVVPEFERRFGNTFPLASIRGWFENFARLVW